MATLFTTALVAEAPTRSPIPPDRPGDAIDALIADIVRPEPRPGAGTEVVQMSAAQSSSRTRLAVARSLVPRERPDNLVRRSTVQRTGMAAPSREAQRVTRAGSICGVPAIKGVPLQSIPGRIRGCGVENPVKVTSVSGIPLSQYPTIDCPTAKALNTWVSDTVIPSVGRLGGGVGEVHVIAHYACRTRNNQRGAKISEHGRGRAVDVAGIILKNGVELSVLDHWRHPQHGKVMQAMWRGACGPFGTVLGPNSDRFHKNHFHLDTARYRSGSYCR
ncbi:extensin-like protein [Maritimibacter sp. DP07]|uniref:Extensin-like protein n=1 Tax=Maritimibacter harenae TaxID=2606218 RepID=A0A845MB47_9RHOB|nr:extensin family protein [Maritimibacter harenae]MZR14754.1 extensin-like protein [Maritimibacter harenae]